MSDFDINFGPWINYGNADKENGISDKMEELVSSSWSPFNGHDYAQVFIFCMSYAFAKNRLPFPRILVTVRCLHLFNVYVIFSFFSLFVE